MVTPFSDTGVDLARFRDQMAFQIRNGSSAVVIAGTTGELSTLKDPEYASLLEQAVESAAGRIKVIAGIGGNDTAKCCERARLAARAGADGVLMSAPYYNKTSPSGLARHFLAAADASPLPLILYNVPSRTAIGIPLDIYRQLSQHPNINGVKEASGDFSLITALSAECSDSLNLWSGNDDHTIPMMALGARGVVSVASNLEPAAVAKLCALCLQGLYDSARKLYAEYAELFRLLFVETNPIPVKYAMMTRGMDSGLLRLPLVPISERNAARLDACLTALKRFSY